MKVSGYFVAVDSPWCLFTCSAGAGALMHCRRKDPFLLQDYTGSAGGYPPKLQVLLDDRIFSGSSPLVDQVLPLQENGSLCR